MRFILKPIYIDLGFEEQPYESHVQLKHRALIIKQACFFGYDPCVINAQRAYRTWMTDKTKNL